MLHLGLGALSEASARAPLAVPYLLALLASLTWAGLRRAERFVHEHVRDTCQHMQQRKARWCVHEPVDHTFGLGRRWDDTLLAAARERSAC